jgi:mRNA interferase RelE/StbE
MAFRISITAEAESQFKGLAVRQRRSLEAAIQARLMHQPQTPTKSIKKLRPNPLAEFELRVGDLRLLYNVEGVEVVLLVVGRKVGNKLIVKGEEFHGHQDNSSEPAGS